VPFADAVSSKADHTGFFKSFVYTFSFLWSGALASSRAHAIIYRILSHRKKQHRVTEATEFMTSSKTQEDKDLCQISFCALA